MSNAYLNLGQTDGFDTPGRQGDRNGKLREIFISDGTKIYVESRDPYGFWYVKSEVGKVPEALTGTFTTAELAVRAVETFYNNTKFNKTVVPEQVEKPVLKYKREKEVA